MTNKQLAFCEEYVICLNQSKAYQKIYNSSAYTNCFRLMQLPEIHSYIQYLLAKVNLERIASAEQVLIEITEIAFDVMGRKSDKLKALELLCKYHNILNPEKITSDVEINVKIDDGDYNE